MKLDLVILGRMAMECEFTIRIVDIRRDLFDNQRGEEDKKFTIHIVNI